MKRKKFYFKISKDGMEDRCKSAAVFCTLFFTSINTFTANIVRGIGLSSHPFTVVLALLIFGSVIACSILSLTRIKLIIIIYPFLMLVLFLFSCLMSVENLSYLMTYETLSGIWVMGIPSYLCVSTLKDYRYMYGLYHKFSSAVILMQCYSSVIEHLHFPWSARSNYMEISYQLLMAVVFLVLMDKKRMSDWILISLGILLIVFDGARGALIGIAGVLVYSVLVKIKKRKMFVLAVAGSGCIFSAVLFPDKIQRIVFGFAARYGFQGSFIRRIQNGSVFESDSRIRLYQAAQEAVCSNWLLGGGMISDRVAGNGVYAHNFFLEVWVQFGIVSGSIAIGIFLWMIMRMFMLRETDMKKIFLSFFFSTGFVKLMLSSSYLLEPGFYIMLALLIKNAASGFRLNRRYAVKIWERKST